MVGRKRHGGGGGRSGERMRKTDWREGWKKSRKSNGFEEHDSNQFLILAGGKEGGGEKRKRRRKRNGERRHEGVSLILWTDSKMNEEIVH